MEATGLVIGKRDLTGVSVYSIPGLVRVTLQMKIEDLWGLDRGSLFRRTRLAEYVLARHMYISLCFDFFCSSPSILVRRLPGGFDHSTIYHCHKTCRNLVETDRWFREKYLEAREGILSGLLTGPKI